MKSLVVAVAVMAASCSGAASTSTTEVDCLQPPGSALEQSSALEMSLDPNPVTSRQIAELVVDGVGFSDEAMIGVDARWQCWDGSDWVTTHIVYRGFGDNPGETIPVNSDFQIQVPDIALRLDRAYSISAPLVEAGTYRIRDEVVAGNETVGGFVVVEVLGG